MTECGLLHMFPFPLYVFAIHYGIASPSIVCDMEVKSYRSGCISDLLIPVVLVRFISDHLKGRTQL